MVKSQVPMIPQTCPTVAREARSLAASVGAYDKGLLPPPRRPASLELHDVSLESKLLLLLFSSCCFVIVSSSCWILHFYDCWSFPTFWDRGGQDKQIKTKQPTTLPLGQRSRGRTKKKTWACVRGSSRHLSTTGAKAVGAVIFGARDRAAYRTGGCLTPILPFFLLLFT